MSSDNIVGSIIVGVAVLGAGAGACVVHAAHVLGAALTVGVKPGLDKLGDAAEKSQPAVAQA